MNTPERVAKRVLRRGRLQFGLRSLLLLVTVIGTPMGWFAFKLQEARRQKLAVEQINKLGGFVGYDYEVGTRGSFRTKPVPPGSPELRSLLGDDFFQRAYQVDFRAATDEDLKPVSQLTSLVVLMLRNTQVTDDGLESLSHLRQLKHLSLYATRTSDRGLAVIGKMSQLESLDLSCTQITDDGLRELDHLTHLKRLILDSDWIKDSGAEHLLHHTELEYLSLRGTQVRDSEVKTLRQALPHCQIFRWAP